MKISNESIAHAILRIGLGLDFVGHGLARIGQLPAFAQSMSSMFAKSLLPPPIVVAMAYAIPPVELIAGIGIVLGILLRPCPRCSRRRNVGFAFRNLPDSAVGYRWHPVDLSSDFVVAACHVAV